MFRPPGALPPEYLLNVKFVISPVEHAPFPLRVSTEPFMLTA